MLGFEETNIAKNFECLQPLKSFLGRPFGDQPINSLVFEITMGFQERRVLNKSERVNWADKISITNFSETKHDFAWAVKRPGN